MKEFKNYSISDIKKYLQCHSSFDNIFYQQLLLDPRKGVQQAAKQWKRNADKIKEVQAFYRTHHIIEEENYQKGFQMIAGIDEAGRGPLAGPVVAAAVILDPQCPIYGLKDSKQLSSKERLRLFNEIKAKAISYSISYQSAQQIDQINIYEATRRAMTMAVEQLNPVADLLLIDAMTIDTNIPQIRLIKGDDRSNSIAAASILAKVTRDELMVQYSEKYPHYGFESNKGYGTAEHLRGLKLFGACPIHRKSFQPVTNFQ